jgi:hypothetical protein
LGNVNWLLTIPNPNALATWGVEQTQGQKKPIDNKLHLDCSQFCTTLLPTPTGVLIKIIILKSA